MVKGEWVLTHHPDGFWLLSGDEIAEFQFRLLAFKLSDGHFLTPGDPLRRRLKLSATIFKKTPLCTSIGVRQVNAAEIHILITLNLIVK